MEVKRHQSLKEHNMYMLLYELYLRESATMADLIHTTGLSQSSVRNMLRDLEGKQIISEVGMDQSTGGRRASRFMLKQDSFTLLCIYLHAEQVDYQIIRPDQLIEYGNIAYHQLEELIRELDQLIAAKKIQHVSIAVEGIVKEDVYYTDHKDDFRRHEWIHQWKQTLSITVSLANDVRMMQYGMAYEEPALQDFAYLYINRVGMSCASMKMGMQLTGHKGIIGELGLLPYDGKTINQAVRECESQQQYETILLHLLCMICITIDPAQIVVSSTLPYPIDLAVLQTKLADIVFEQYPLALKVRPHDYLFLGLQSLGIEALLRKISQEATSIPRPLASAQATKESAL